MSQDKKIDPPSTPRRHEQRGLVQDVVAPFLSSAGGAGVGTYVAHKLQGGGDAPPSDPPPSVELPPGVDGE